MRCIFFWTVIFVFIALKGFAQPYQIGHTQQTFIDVARADRNIAAEIYYPSITTGENVPIAGGQFPVLIFGHGFVMVWSAYDIVWEALVPEGYIMAFPNTETSFSPSHIDFAKDIAFLAGALKAEGEDATSLFYESVAGTSAVMGHSMGGGSAFLSLQYDSTITALATLAPANTNPSAILAATDISIPAIIFSGSNDCVTPPPAHQIPMYDSLVSDCKSFVSITGGSHCQFASYNFLCSVGEGTCSPDPDISPVEQQTITFNMLLPWLNFYLKNDCEAGPQFQGLITAGNGITSEQNCTLTCTGTKKINESDASFLKSVPNPFYDETVLESKGIVSDATLTAFNTMGQMVKQVKHVSGKEIKFNRDDLPAGIYYLRLTQNRRMYGTVKLVCID